MVASLIISEYDTSCRNGGWNKSVSANKNTELSNETLMKCFGIVRFFYSLCFVNLETFRLYEGTI